MDEENVSHVVVGGAVVMEQLPVKIFPALVLSETSRDQHPL